MSFSVGDKAVHPAHGVGEITQIEERLAEISDEESGAALRRSFGGRLGHLIEPVLEPLGFDWKIGVGLLGAFAALFPRRPRASPATDRWLQLSRQPSLRPLTDASMTASGRPQWR